MEQTPPALREDGLRNKDPDTVLVLLVSFLVPGAGHVWIGSWRKGFGFFMIIGLLFSMGLLLGGRLYEFDSRSLLSILATVASHGSGMLDLGARFAGWTGNPASRTHEYGTTFILTAGLMNLLLLFDLWERLSDAPVESEETLAETDPADA